jgi:hypothetical protein
MAKITKDNYNELKKKELDNNFAKVWHVNEIREELLANTPEGAVSEISNVDVGYSGAVVLGNSQFSVIDSDYGIKIHDNGSNGFNLISRVPYHEVIGTITFEEEHGKTAPPSLTIQVNTALASSPPNLPSGPLNGFLRANWEINSVYYGDALVYRLSITNEENMVYRDGIFISNKIYGVSPETSGVPYELSVVTPFTSTHIDIFLIESYISGGNIKTQIVDLNSNVEAVFQFHLILPLDQNT